MSAKTRIPAIDWGGVACCRELRDMLLPAPVHLVKALAGANVCSSVLPAAGRRVRVRQPWRFQRRGGTGGMRCPRSSRCRPVQENGPCSSEACLFVSVCLEEISERTRDETESNVTSCARLGIDRRSALRRARADYDRRGAQPVTIRPVAAGSGGTAATAAARPAGSSPGPGRSRRCGERPLDHPHR